MLKSDKGKKYYIFYHKQSMGLTLTGETINIIFLSIKMYNLDKWGVAINKVIPFI